VSIPRLNALLADELRALDQTIRARLHSEVLLVRQVAEYIIHSGGKRLRPALVMLSASALGYEGPHHVELAAVVEFIHTATLLHDDVVDESKLRRGQDTANARFGNATSVLVGDFLYSRAFQMMVSVQNMRVMEVLADATNTIAEGEVLQLMNCHDPEVDEASYMRVIRYKTARLFDAAGRLGAIISGQPQEVETALGNYGMHLGTAFQLIDDVLDYSGDKESTGKNVGDDLAEGKPTLPLLYVMRNGSAEQSELVRWAIAKGGTDDFSAILAAIQNSGALEYTRRQAQIESDAAVAALSGLPHGVYRDALLELAAFAVNRNY
jgi:octaprenyl-diphosphate synthase